jgi:hypothetical protein
MADDRTPKVTPHLMERGVDMCPRRLAHELEGRDADAGAFTRWRVRTPLVDAATLAHRPDASTPPTLADFPLPPDLVHEEAVVWRHAAAVYVDRFAAVPATSIDHGCDRATESARFGVRVGGAVDVLVHLDDGDPDADVELRQFELWGRSVHADPAASWESTLAALRLARVLSGQRLRIRHVDLLRGEDDVALVDYDTDLPALRERFARRLDELRDRAATAEAVPGTGCGQCRHIAGCPAHKEVA